MSKKINVLDLVQDQGFTTEDAKKQDFWMKLILSVVGFSVLTALAVASLTGFFARTDFNQTIPLTQNIAQWERLGINKAYDEQFTNSWGTWDREEALFTNSSNSCYMNLIPLQSMTDRAGDDSTGTEAYGKLLGITEDLGTAKIAVVGHTGSVEFKVGRIINQEGHETIIYYRDASVVGSLLSVAIGCGENTELLNEIYEENKTSLDKFGIKLEIMK